MFNSTEQEAFGIKKSIANSRCQWHLGPFPDISYSRSRLVANTLLFISKRIQYVHVCSSSERILLQYMGKELYSSLHPSDSTASCSKQALKNLHGACWRFRFCTPVGKGRPFQSREPQGKQTLGAMQSSVKRGHVQQSSMCRDILRGEKQW